MTDTDYNRRVAEALGWTHHAHCWFNAENEVDGLKDYATDWTQLPAILAALDKFGGWRIYRNVWVGRAVGEYLSQSWVVKDGLYLQAAGDNLLLAAGALLLKLAEGKS